MNTFPKTEPRFKRGDLFTTRKWIEAAEEGLFCARVESTIIDNDDPTKWVYCDDNCEYWTKEEDMIFVGQ